MGATPSALRQGGRNEGNLPASLLADEAWLDLPVEQVSWDDISRPGGFLARTGLRLPTESQWEYACRGGTTTPFAFGDCISTDQLNCPGADASCPEYLCEPRVFRTHTVPVAPDDERWSGGVFGVFPANPFGLYHMHGNVREWCADWLGEYPTSPVTDPEGPRTGVSRVARGGSWNDSPRGCRSANRLWDSPSFRLLYLGFRPARPLP